MVDSCEREDALIWELAALRGAKKIELKELLLREEVHQGYRAREKLVKEGDYNSKYFRSVVNGRRKKKYIKSLVPKDKVLLESNKV